MSDETKPDGTFEKFPGGKATVWYDGKAWDVPMLDAATDLPEAETYLRGKRKNPLDAITGKLQGVPEDIAREMLDRAYRDLKKGDEESRIPVNEVADWLDTADGFHWMMHRAMRRLHPDLTIDTVKAMFHKVGLVEALAMRDKLLEG